MLAAVAASTFGLTILPAALGSATDAGGLSAAWSPNAAAVAGDHSAMGQAIPHGRWRPVQLPTDGTFAMDYAVSPVAPATISWPTPTTNQGR